MGQQLQRWSLGNIFLKNRIERQQTRAVGAFSPLPVVPRRPICYTLRLLYSANT